MLTDMPMSTSELQTYHEALAVLDGGKPIAQQLQKAPSWISYFAIFKPNADMLAVERAPYPLDKNENAPLFPLYSGDDLRKVKAAATLAEELTAFVRWSTGGSLYSSAQSSEERLREVTPQAKNEF